MSVSGTWNLKISTPMGVQSAVLVLHENDGAVTGTAASGDETVTLNAISSQGQTLRWEQKVTTPFPTMVTFDMTFDGDTATGTAKPGLFPGSKVTGTRA